MQISKYIISIIVLSILIISCSGEVTVPVPKPRMYPRVDFPNREYQAYNSPDCNYSFEYPKYANVIQDKYQFGDQSVNECWFNLEFSNLNASLHCDYTSIDKEKFGSLLQDAFKIVSKHNIKANFREESIIQNEQNVAGLLFSIKGPVATPYQFYLSDTTEHFFRASLYFNSRVNPDSMKIIHDFIKTDIDHMIKTFSWTSL